jgi:protein-S-isoprenylcysteine O-methyltransferase Ste14
MSPGTVVRAMIVQSVTGLVLTALILFLPAGTLAWPQGWVFLVLLIGCGLVTDVDLLRRDPALLAARMKSPISPDQKPRDRAVMRVILVFFIGWMAFMPLDARRFGWSHAPLWAEVCGGGLMLAAFWGWSIVLRANTFAATTIELQAARGQTVITTGPYAVVRHPLYGFTLLFMLGAPLLLGSFWGLAGLVIFIPLLAARALGEEALLRAGLPGYADYTEKVRFRFAPGIW